MYFNKPFQVLHNNIQCNIPMHSIFPHLSQNPWSESHNLTQEARWINTHPYTIIRKNMLHCPNYMQVFQVILFLHDFWHELLYPSEISLCYTPCPSHSWFLLFPVSYHILPLDTNTWINLKLSTKNTCILKKYISKHSMKLFTLSTGYMENSMCHPWRYFEI